MIKQENCRLIVELRSIYETKKTTMQSRQMRVLYKATTRETKHATQENETDGNVHVYWVDVAVKWRKVK